MQKSKRKLLFFILAMLTTKSIISLENEGSSDEENSHHIDSPEREQAADSYQGLAISSKECVICYEDKNDAVKLPCNHEFCFACLHEWLGKQPTCPLCRNSYTRENIKRNSVHFIETAAKIAIPGVIAIYAFYRYFTKKDRANNQLGDEVKESKSH